MSTSVVLTWLQESLAEQSANDATLTPALARGDSVRHRRFLSNALVYLLRRLGLPGVRLPETLVFDGRRLVETRDEMDRLTLIAVFSTIMRQFLAGLRVRVSPDVVAAMETRLYTLLQDAGNVKLPDLVEEVRTTNLPTNHTLQSGSLNGSLQPRAQTGSRRQGVYAAGPPRLLPSPMAYPDHLPLLSVPPSYHARW